MSKLQKITKPLLIPFLRGDWIALSAIDQQKLATWATMFTMVREFASMEGGTSNAYAPPTTAIPQTERSYFMEHKSPPPKNWIIAIGAYGPAPANCLMGYNWLSLKPPHGSDSGPITPNVQSTVFAAGGVFFHAFSTTSDSFFETAANAFDGFSSFGLHRIWPINKVNSERKPPRNNFEILQYNDYFFNYLLNFSRNLPAPPVPYVFAPAR